MITNSDLSLLQHWAKSTIFPMRREGITSKYMKYDPSVCYVKFGKKKKETPRIPQIENYPFDERSI